MGRVVVRVLLVVIISSDAGTSTISSEKASSGRCRRRHVDIAVAGVAAQAEVTAGIVARGGQRVVRVLRGAALVEKLVVHHAINKYASQSWKCALKCLDVLISGWMDRWADSKKGREEIMKSDE